MNARTVWKLLRATYEAWMADKAPRLAAAFAYYTVFALAPVLVIALGFAELFLSGAEDQAIAQIQRLIGPHAAEAVRTMLAPRTSSKTDWLATIIGFATLLVGATGLFAQLQDALDTIWQVQPKPDQGVVAMMKNRFFSFTMVLGIGFLMLVSLVLSAVLETIAVKLGGPAEDRTIAWKIVEASTSFLVTTGLFAATFKIVPDAEVRWRDVWIGAVATAVLFAVGKEVISAYLATENAASSYGAAGALVLLLIWIYYSAQILFLGAEFTKVYAREYGSGIQPAPNAEPVRETAREEQGIPRTA
ncbi:MAG TPA: YihY/virulence factor BrkB family protein [Candidatus Binatia bacterium]|nr:YihY/virulence factor BrkB family protein [Candidatus Binatia bacterium]